MKVGVISDIHSNISALKSVLDEFRERNIETLVCAGDIIGVLGESSESVRLVKENAGFTVYGNHDSRVFPSRKWLPVSDYEIVEYENTMETLSEEEYQWLISLPEIVTNAYKNITLAHSRPVNGLSEGVLEYDDAGVHSSEFIKIAGDYFTRDGEILILGHTHRQNALNVGKFKGQYQSLILNPGSVGFPYKNKFTNGSPYGKASFAIVDTETLEYELCSIEYDSTEVFEYLSRNGLEEEPNGQNNSY